MRVFAGNVFLNGAVAGDVLVLAATLPSPAAPKSAAAWSSSGDTWHQDRAAISLRHTVLSPNRFLPMVLVIAAIIEGLIVLTRRMVRGPVTFPPLPRL